MTTLKEKLGKRIKEIRKSRNLTQEKLAEMIGLDTPNLSNIERGKRFLSSETLEKIVKSLNLLTLKQTISKFNLYNLL